MDSPSSVTSAIQDFRFGSRDKKEKLYTAPEGLPKLHQLRAISEEIGEALRNPLHKYLRGLANAWRYVELELADVGALIKLERYQDREAYLDSLSLTPLDKAIKDVFLYTRAKGITGETSELRPKFKTAVEYLPREEMSKALTSKFDAFWYLWPEARQEVMSKGSDINRQYKALALGNRLYKDREGFFPGEPPRYGDSRFPEEDACTIFSALSRLGPTKEEDDQTFEMQSVGKVAVVIAERASQGYERDALNSFAQSSTDSGLSTAGSSDARTELGKGTRKALGFRRLDPSLLKSHLLPKLTGDQRSLGQSLGRGSNILLQEARDKLQSGEAERAKQIGEMASLLRVVQHAIEQDQRSLHSESVGPSATTQSNDSTVY